MVLEVHLYSDLRRYAPTSSTGMLAVDVPDGIVVEELLNELEINYTEIKTIVVNGSTSDLQQVLEDGDHISLFP
ncbi:mut7-c ubiquitin [Lucifera butyrica]|uniref:Mut7-c ubiquitin n=1 Tax=Lucifera butyrica TaxID=1351585 RepID=A0A498RCY3_9FIRM|nr:MoaD/ThiS family protein [Lucifera butyrica]VBB08720.1 mut7-c ubiquitin [Lucifera butyrica]